MSALQRFPPRTGFTIWPVKALQFKEIATTAARTRVERLLSGESLLEAQAVMADAIIDFDDAQQLRDWQAYRKRRLRPLLGLRAKWRGKAATAAVLQSRADQYPEDGLGGTVRIGMEDPATGVINWRKSEPYVVTPGSPTYKPAAMRLMRHFVTATRATRRDAARATALMLHAYGMVPSPPDIEDLALKLEQQYRRASGK